MIVELVNTKNNDSEFLIDILEKILHGWNFINQDTIIKLYTQVMDKMRDIILLVIDRADRATNKERNNLHNLIELVQRIATEYSALKVEDTKRIEIIFLVSAAQKKLGIDSIISKNNEELFDENDVKPVE